MNWFVLRFNKLWERLLFYRFRRRRNIPPPVGRHYFIDSSYIAIGRMYERRSDHARWLNQQDSIRDIPAELIYAHDSLLGVVAATLEENSGKQVPSENEEIRRKFVLLMSFIQGISLCEQSILQGLYLQAGSLVRQEYETLILLNEVQKGRRRDGKSPNTTNFPWDSRGLYPLLSALTHLSNHYLLEAIVGYNTTWGDYASALPQYRKNKTIELYGLHIGLLLGAVENLALFYIKTFDYKPEHREQEVLKAVTGILMKHRFFTTPIMVSDLDKSVGFYEKILDVAGYCLSGRDSKEALFILKQGTNNFGSIFLKKGNGGIAKHGHIVIEVSGVEIVKRFYSTALESGGKDAGVPKQYPEYGVDYYGSFILDFDSNKIGVAVA